MNLVCITELPCPCRKETDEAGFCMKPEGDCEYQMLGCEGGKTNRLTTDKPVGEMDMAELLHNACYVGLDDNAWYRNYDMDEDARWLAIKLLGDLADIPNEFTCDEDFDQWAYDCTYDGFDSVEGLIATFYNNIWAMADLRERLKEYEDLEEQGKLLKLPCAVGDTLYRFYNLDGKRTIYEHHIKTLTNLVNIVESGEIGITVFLTREEAEATLKELTN